MLGSRRLRRIAAFTAAAAVLPFAATQAVHMMFRRPLLDSADVAMVSVLFELGVVLLATFGFAGAARELDPPELPVDPQ
jgi:hypothetical protein